MDEILTNEMVEVVYLLFLRRPLKNAEERSSALHLGTLDRLRAYILDSEEFQELRRLDWNQRVGFLAPPIRVDWQADDATARQLLDRLRADKNLNPPQFGVDTERDIRGKKEVMQLCEYLERNSFDWGRLCRAFHFGNQDAWVTHHMLRTFQSVECCDILYFEQARGRLSKCTSVNFVEDLTFGMRLPFDLWYSKNELQTYPPPLIARILDRAFRLLLPGGVAVFQLLSYIYDYHFELPGMTHANFGQGPHALLDETVFEIASASACKVYETFQEEPELPTMSTEKNPFLTIPNTSWRSKWYVVHRRPRSRSGNFESILRS